MNAVDAVDAWLQESVVCRGPEAGCARARSVV